MAPDRMKKILVIEDNQSIRDNIVEFLELQNFNVVVAENGAVGLERAFVENPDLIVCDIVMPERNGVDLYLALRTTLNLCRVPFVFLSAKAQDVDIEEGLRHGADAYITKPFQVEELLSTIRSLLS